MTKKEKEFVAVVWEYYRRHGRHDIPWRLTKDPYKILVSEVMLQQTQVDRVIPKYESFLKKFPTVERLSKAPLKEVLILWQGLGYNRRAKKLHECAGYVLEKYGGVFPKIYDELLQLPGIGPYTASAVMAFAFDISTVLIETNVRTVYLHHFFKNKTEISDVELLPIIQKTLDVASPREWYYALMDYGSYIKKTFGNKNTQSAHYTKQSAFKGSDRQIRGMVLRQLGQKRQTRRQLHAHLSAFEDIRIDAQLLRLSTEGLIVKMGA